jgi:hypothetical protein
MQREHAKEGQAYAQNGFDEGGKLSAFSRHNPDMNQFLVWFWL